MLSAGWVEIALVVLLVWLILLSLFLLQIIKTFNRLFPNSVDKSSEASILIRQQFESLLKSIEDVSRREKVLRKILKQQALENLNYVKKIEISKYNPFADTGGNQSFSVVFLDSNLNGLILTSLHSRAGTRIYIKPVKKGKSDLELSKEEKELLLKSINDKM